MARKINPWLKWGCLTPILAVVALFTAAYVWDKFVPSSVRRALPESASEVQEFYHESGNGDFSRFLKAKLPESDVPLYAKHLGLSARFDPKVVGGRSLDSFVIALPEIKSWWNPPAENASTYINYDPGHDLIESLRYADGYVYFHASAW